MLSKLSVAALVGSTSAFTPAEKEAFAITKGLLTGAAAAENFGDVPQCIQDAETIIADAKIALADFAKKDLPDIIAGIKELADVLDALEKALADCKFSGDLNKLKKIVATWKSPTAFAYHVGKDLSINGVEIFHEIQAAIGDYK